MSFETLNRTLALVAFAVTISSANGADYQQVVNCQPTAGPLARVIETSEGRPFEVVAAVGSRSISYAFATQDDAGRGIPNVDLEITLPELPEELRFLAAAGDPRLTAKRAVVRVSGTCSSNVPNLIAHPFVGTVDAMVRIVGQGSSVPMPIRTLADPTPVYSRIQGTPPFTLAVVGQPVLVSASAQWSQGAQSGPIAGLQFVFTAPASGPSLRFPDGSNTWTAGTDYNGISSVMAYATAPGVIDTQVTYPDGTTSQGVRYLAIDTRAAVLEDLSVEYGAIARIRGEVQFPNYDCTAPAHLVDPHRSTVRLRMGSWELADTKVEPVASCANGTVSVRFSASIDGIPFGTHEVTAELPANAFPATSATARVTVRPTLTQALATGRGSVRVGTSDPGFASQAGNCRLKSVEALPVSALGMAGPGPQVADLPYGALRLDLDACKFEDTSGFLAQVRIPKVTILLELDEEPARGTVVWAYGPTESQPQAHWHELPTGVAGRFLQFVVIDGGAGDDKTGSDKLLRPLLALGVPKYAAVPGSFQDLWWSGPQENGWGLSITQHRDVLFGALFIYDAHGDPRWLVMPGGSWNDARTSYGGALYSPKGSENHAQLASAFVAGPPAGSLRLTPMTQETMLMEYTIGAASGTKQIRRQPFGAPQAFPTHRYDDLWWSGPAQSGWGFSLSQQQRNLFGVVYTYDARGDPIWYVAPSLVRSGPEATIIGDLYRTRGSPWIGTSYDPSLLAATHAGTLRLSLLDTTRGILDARFSLRPWLQAQIVRDPF